MPRCKQKVQILNRQGLHARPASLFVQLANRFRAHVLVRKGAEEVNGKSIMGLLMLALERGSGVEVVADGPDAKEAVAALAQFLGTDEDEWPGADRTPGPRSGRGRHG